VRTLLEAPLFAIQLLNLHEAGRIEDDTFLLAMDDPDLAKFVVHHESMHDAFMPQETLSYDPSPMDQALAERISFVLEG
jgi:hypothetical protein